MPRPGTCRRRLALGGWGSWVTVQAKMKLEGPRARTSKGSSDWASVAGASVGVRASKRGSKKSSCVWGSVEGNKKGRKPSDLDEKERSKRAAEAKMHGTVFHKGPQAKQAIHSWV